VNTKKKKRENSKRYIKGEYIERGAASHITNALSALCHIIREKIINVKCLKQTPANNAWKIENTWGRGRMPLRTTKTCHSGFFGGFFL